MLNRIIDISECATGLSVRHKQLVIKSQDTETTVPLEEITAIITAHPAIYYTQAVLTGLLEAGGIFIVCDEKHLPSGMLLPLQSNYIQTERFAVQAQASLPLKKTLWKQIVRAKVLAQGKTLELIAGSDHGLSELAKRVQSGDTGNIEAIASQRYWPVLFGHSFRRDYKREDQNRLLNYGYAVLRAMVARAICAVGLHPSLGLHHHNRYDTFCLADDIMEPWRSVVDRVVIKLVADKGCHCPIDRDTKTLLIEAIAMKPYPVKKENRKLFDILTETTSSLVSAYQGKRRKLFLPVL